jgi:hypothetical protein
MAKIKIKINFQAFSEDFILVINILIQNLVPADFHDGSANLLTDVAVVVVLLVLASETLLTDYALALKNVNCLLIYS